MSSNETSAAAKGIEDNVRVAVRCRPMSEKEKKDGRKSVVRMDNITGQVIVKNTKGGGGGGGGGGGRGDKEKVFTFDTVFDTDTKQVDIYNETARPIAEFVLEGYNGTIFAYGQTGTGKTYTMEGERVEPEKRGIIPNSFAHVFGHIAKSVGETQFLVRVAYLELYNEEVRDLLSKNPQKQLEVRERVDIGVYVKDLSSFVVKNADEMDKLMLAGNKNRVFASTQMNDHSSRSHVIFTVTIEQSDIGADKKQHVRMGKLHLVDLAGSERQSKTGAQGQRFTEAVKINLSLSTLGNVIAALVDGHSTHIPYRNSKLTRLLQDSLGGNSKTVMIANVGPADYNADETLNTLRFANRAKNIKNSARINEDPKDAMLREFQKEINELKQILADEACPSDESESDESASDHARKKLRRASSGTLSPRSVACMKAEIEKERARLLATKDFAEGEKNQAQKELELREQELLSAIDQQSELEKKLKELNSKVIRGGVNLLEQAEEQERLLESSAKELEKRRKKEDKLRHQLKQKEEEKRGIEEKYANLQEEADGKTKILKDLWKQFQQAKEEISDMKSEAQQENEEMLDMIRELNKEVKLQTLVINSYVPQEFQEKLEQHVQWHEETGDWYMPGIAYAGNNMKKSQQPTPEPVNMAATTYDTTLAYLRYNVGPHEVHTLSSGESTISSLSSTRPKAARKSTGPTSKTKNSKKKEEKPSDYPTSRGLVSKQQRFA